ncbi:MAG: cysteine synthase A [Flavobacteriales bacterium]|jgi:cysteine synthase A|uniref:cysteine synthase A n=1 Tax=Blattabacterium sp. (Mastotermes darwiniensis) TaxID=39768 RepID=UPI000231DE4B|nr:cysteine synthase A [Blattabacterium sp. (Mastotermes darwiniensis)]AER40639.1 cysteine synthase A [Blattabacterium sp. (Mastotermes darwiniensis) str. MADAR]MDR1804833.1 cysteine synthase A [Flavobacteriales bacterium]
MKVESILQTIGNTPHVLLRRLYPFHKVWMKLERNNPGGSIKDRIALSMIEDAEKKGILKKKGEVIIEPTSGNTGVGLAMVSTVKGYSLILVMPESMSIERRKIFSIFGAKLVLTPREKGMKGAIKKAEELVHEIPNSWMPKQFENLSNTNIHKSITSKEIIDSFPDGIDYFVTGVGTGGHITGIGEVLKKKFPDIKIFSVEPVESPVIFGGEREAKPHALQGLGAGFIPPILNVNLLDGTFLVSKEEAFYFVRKTAIKEGILVGISTGAVLSSIEKHLSYFSKDSRILTFNYDSGERYLSVEDLFL